MVLGGREWGLSLMAWCQLGSGIQRGGYTTLGRTPSSNKWEVIVFFISFFPFLFCVHQKAGRLEIQNMACI